MENLRRKIVAKQREGKYSDRAFAELLGISRPTWTLIRNGKAPIGPKVMSAVVRHFPSLADEVLKTLAGQSEQVA